jgi:hypothetical protein
VGDCRRIATVDIGATGFEPRHRANVMQDDCRGARRRLASRQSVAPPASAKRRDGNSSAATIDLAQGA